jgi:hypothetical protein
VREVNTTQSHLKDGARQGAKSEIIKSVSYNETKILKWIMRLYCPGGFEVDPTYSRGIIYKKVTAPKLKFDINPQAPGVVKADCRYLPLGESTIGNIVFDPPFVGGGGKKGIIRKRFTGFKSIPLLWQFYRESMREFNRILKDNGILVVKCQDVVESGKQFLSHVEVVKMASEEGFYPKDLFVLIAKKRIMRYDQKQQHARKFHCYYLVFEKVKNRRQG